MPKKVISQQNLSPLQQIFETIGGARHGVRISTGLTFEEAIARKIQECDRDSKVYHNFAVRDDARRHGGLHNIDIVQIKKDVIIGYEIKSRDGISHTIPGAHMTDVENMKRYCKELEEKFPGKSASFIIIRKGGEIIKEHQNAGFVTKNISDYLTDDEYEKIAYNESKMLDRLKHHSNRFGFSLTEDNINNSLESLRIMLLKAGFKK